MRGREDFGFGETNYWTRFRQRHVDGWGHCHGWRPIRHDLLIRDVQLPREDRRAFESGQSLQRPRALRLRPEREAHVWLKPRPAEIGEGALGEPVEKMIEPVFTASERLVPEGRLRKAPAK